MHKIIFLQVRSFFRSCNGAAACNCGVAARAEDDVILFDVCGPEADSKKGARPLTKQIYQNGELSQGFTVEEEHGGKFFVVIS